MLNKCPLECERCKSRAFEDTASSWKCKKCGKHIGKVRQKIISAVIPLIRGRVNWFTEKTADRIEMVRPDLKTAKIIDRKRKKSYTEILEDDGTSKIIQERDL